VTWRFHPEWTAVVMLDFAKQLRRGGDDSYLQDAILQWRFHPQWRWWIGQFKIPLSEEGLHAAGDLDTIERAQFNQGRNKIGDLRELGSMVEFKDPHWLAQLGVFSGDPNNQSIAFSIHEAALRVLYSPQPDVQFGGAITRGSRHNVDRPLDRRERSDKQGVEFRWYSRPWLVQAEYVSGRLDVPLINRRGDVTSIVPTHRDGWYAKLRYEITPDIHLVARADQFTPQSGRGETDLTLGVNWWIQRKPVELRLQINYVNRRAYGPIPPVPSMWRANFQLFF